jgi:hypothetical protein
MTEKKPTLEYERPGWQPDNTGPTEYELPEKPRRCIAGALSLCAGAFAVATMVIVQPNWNPDLLEFAGSLVFTLVFCGLALGCIGSVFGRHCRRVGVCGLLLNLGITFFILGHARL